MNRELQRDVAGALKKSSLFGVFLVALAMFILLPSGSAEPLSVNGSSEELTVLNPQSYPILNGEWIVEFETDGEGPLRISVVEETSANDLEFVELRCGDFIVTPSGSDDVSVSVDSWSCDTTGYHTVKVLTTGVHTQQFDFANFTDYAHNLVFGTSIGPGFSVVSNASSNFSINGSSKDRLGSAVAVGDINGDGIIDLVVTAWKSAPANSGANAGRIFVFFGPFKDGFGTGNSFGVNASANFSINGSSANNYMGDFCDFSLSVANINNDSMADIIIGARLADSASGGVDSGKLYIFYGRDIQGYGNGNSFDADLHANVTINGSAGGDNFGNKFTTGDVNGDGTNDIIVGAYSADPPGRGSNAGKVYIFYGDSINLSGYGPGNSFDANTSANITINGSAGGDILGLALLTGDLNNDGKADIIIGGYDTDPPNRGVDAGKTYVFYGGDFGVTGYGTGNSFDANTSANFTINGSAGGDKFGRTLAIGDVNDDGLSDLIVSAYFEDPPNRGINAGKVYIFYGSDLKGYGPGNSFDANTSANVTINGSAGNDRFGQSLATGDVNGDGIVDIIASADGGKPAAGGLGKFHVFYGGGIFSTGYGTGNSFDANASANFTINASAEDDFGDGSSVAADLNNDGLADIVLGIQRTYNPLGGSNAGKVYIFYSSLLLPNNPTVTPAIATDTNSSSAGVTTAFTGDHLFGYANFSAINGEFEGNSTFKWWINDTDVNGVRTADLIPFIYRDAVAYYHLDGDAFDSSGFGNDGTISGATSVEDGRIKGAYGFDGVDDYVSAPTNGFNTNTGTLSVWVKPTGNTRGNYTIVSTPTEISNNDSGLVLLLHMNEGSDNTCGGGEDVCDTSGSGNDGSFVDSAAFTTDSRFGASAVTFDETDDHIVIADSASISTGDVDYTITAWVNLDSKIGGGSRNKFVTKDDDNGFEFSLAHFSGTDKFYFEVRDGGALDGTVIGEVNSIEAPSLGIWYFVVAWHDSVNNEVGIVVNGGSVNTSATTGTCCSSTGSTMYIGAGQGGTAPPLAESEFDGRIDEVAMYKKVLTPAEITHIIIGTRTIY